MALVNNFEFFVLNPRSKLSDFRSILLKMG
jgi:hypothetical protein